MLAVDGAAARFSALLRVCGCCSRTSCVRAHAWIERLGCGVALVVCHVRCCMFDCHAALVRRALDVPSCDRRHMVSVAAVYYTSSARADAHCGPRTRDARITLENQRRASHQSELSSGRDDKCGSERSPRATRRLAPPCQHTESRNLRCVKTFSAGAGRLAPAPPAIRIYSVRSNRSHPQHDPQRYDRSDRNRRERSTDHTYTHGLSCLRCSARLHVERSNATQTDNKQRLATPPCRCTQPRDSSPPSASRDRTGVRRVTRHDPSVPRVRERDERRARRAGYAAPGSGQRAPPSHRFRYPS